MQQPDHGISLDAIDAAEDEAGLDTAKFSEDKIRSLIEENSRLRAKIEGLEAALESTEGQLEVEEVRAQLMQPYANKVFRFLVGYCAIVGLLLVLQGFSVWNFELETPVLAIIAGSTAASAIGLVGFVVNGLFKASR